MSEGLGGILGGAEEGVARAGQEAWPGQGRGLVRGRGLG